jgi:hypothetical protein
VSNQNVEEIEEVEILTILLRLFLEETETDEKFTQNITLAVITN